jgi:hypothetical protein
LVSDEDLYVLVDGGEGGMLGAYYGIGDLAVSAKIAISLQYLGIRGNTFSLESSRIIPVARIRLC